MNLKDFRMPIFAEVSVTTGEHDSWIIGYDQHKGLWILLEDGTIKTFYRDEILKIISKIPGFPCKGSQIMRIRASQSQQWAEELPAFGSIGQELQFNLGPSKKQLEEAEKEIHKPTRSKSRQKTAASHWIGMN